MQSKSLALAKQFLGKEVEVTVDRPIGSKHPSKSYVYKANYGYIEGVPAPDGEDLDAYYLGLDVPVEKARGVTIAIIHREDDDDDKLVVVPHGTTLTDDEIKAQTDFQEQWFKSSIVRLI
jgi:inorganic pyrophosphatase